MLQRKSLRKKKKVVKKKKQETWLEVKQEIRPKFLEADIYCCELKWDGCKGCMVMYLTFAHSLRRRKIDKLQKEERAKAMREVIRACSACHYILDSMAHDETYQIVREVIKNRTKPVI
jgi:hypothetical protein